MQIDSELIPVFGVWAKSGLKLLIFDLLEKLKSHLKKPSNLYE